MVMNGDPSEYDGVRKIQPGERVWHRQVDYGHAGWLKANVYKKTDGTWYIHLLFDPKTLRWTQGRPYKHMYVGDGQPKTYSPEQIE